MLIRWINKALACIAVALIFIMMISIGADVTLRYFANAPIVGTLEFNRTLLVVVVFFSLAYAQSRKQHINVDLLLLKLSKRNRKIIDILELGLSLLLCLVFVYGTFKVAYTSTMEGEYEMGIVSFPMWPGRIAIVVGLAMLCAQYALDIVNRWKS